MPASIVLKLDICTRMESVMAVEACGQLVNGDGVEKWNCAAISLLLPQKQYAQSFDVRLRLSLALRELVPRQVVGIITAEYIRHQIEDFVLRKLC